MHSQRYTEWAEDGPIVVLTKRQADRWMHTQTDTLRDADAGGETGRCAES